MCRVAKITTFFPPIISFIFSLSQTVLPTLFPVLNFVILVWNLLLVPSRCCVVIYCSSSPGSITFLALHIPMKLLSPSQTGLLGHPCTECSLQIPSCFPHAFPITSLFPAIVLICKWPRHTLFNMLATSYM